MKKFFPVLLGLFLLAACAAPTPAPTLIPIPPTRTLDPQTCFYSWGYQPLEELTAEFQSALVEVIPTAKGTAQAYGENCTKPDHTSTFSTMETDFNVILPVPDLTDEEAIGLLIEQILKVVDEFARPRVPGPQDGIVSFTVTSGENHQIFRVPIQIGKELREQGLTGAALLQAILAK